MVATVRQQTALVQGGDPVCQSPDPAAPSWAHCKGPNPSLQLICQTLLLV